MMKLNRFLFIFFLFYVSFLPRRLGLISLGTNEIVQVILALIGSFSFTIYLGRNKYKINSIDGCILFLLIIYPIISSITAKIIAGQPLYMGWLTFRYYFVLLMYYFFRILNITEENVLADTKNVTWIIIITIIILFLGFGMNDFNLEFKKGTLITKYGLTTTKGIQFSGYSWLFFIPYIEGWTKFFEKGKIKDLILPMIILLIVVLISKERNFLLSLIIFTLLLYYLKYRLFDVNFFFISVLLLGLFTVIFITDNPFSRSMSGLFHPTDLEFAYKTGDYSAYLRIEEIKAGWKWIVKYPITGVGSLSYRYNNGYLGFISDNFFIADVGIFGILVKGGLILFLFYIYFYYRLLKYFENENYYSVIGRYLTFFLIIELFLGNDFLFNNPSVFVVVFLMGKDLIRNCQKT